jgi:hypothetical protein
MSETDIKPIHQSLFPTKNSLLEVTEFLHAQMPFDTPNQLHAALMTYQNTLLHVLNKEISNDNPKSNT